MKEARARWIVPTLGALLVAAVVPSISANPQPSSATAHTSSSTPCTSSPARSPASSTARTSCVPRALDVVHEGFQFSDGDLILHESRSTQSAVIKAVTRSRYSHVGLVFGVREGRPYVLEAVQPVRSTPLPTWIRRGREGHFVVARLPAGLDTQEVEALRREAEKFIGRDYDGRFDWSDERIYCSELVWKAYERALGIRLIEPETWRSLDLSDSRARRLAKERLGRMPEPDALVVTPARLLESPLLVLIGEEASDRRAVTRGRFGHR